MAALVGMAAIALVTVEAVRAPIGLTPARPVPSVYHALALEPRAVVAEYPMHAPFAIALNAEYMLYSTRHWKPMVNGYSGFLPASYRDNWPRLNAFPEPAALESLVTLGVTHVVVHGSGRIAAAERVRGLTRVVSTPELAIYRLDRTAIEDARSLRR
jgi:hypothetical protein